MAIEANLWLHIQPVALHACNFGVTNGRGMKGRKKLDFEKDRVLEEIRHGARSAVSKLNESCRSCRLRDSSCLSY